MQSRVTLIMSVKLCFLLLFTIIASSMSAFYPIDDASKSAVYFDDGQIDDGRTCDFDRAYVCNLPLKYICGYPDAAFQCKHLKIDIVRESENEKELEFDLKGFPISLANAFRRILISEVPSMAIEKVYIVNNTSLIQDEVLAHRLGLVPLRADPRLFEYPSDGGKDDDEVSDQDTLRYEIKVTCTWNPQAPKDSRRQSDIYRNSNVYSKDIKWVPIGRQRDIYPRAAEQFGVLENDILICKMRPGQEIHVFMHAVKGLGKDHAKFSPVATASYRLLPDIQIIKPVKGEMADRLKSCFSVGVIEVTEEKQGHPDSREAYVKNPRYDSCSRNVFQHEDLKGCVKLSRVLDHVIFTVESVGTLPSATLFIESVKTLKGKCKTFLEELENIGQ